MSTRGAPPGVIWRERAFYVVAPSRDDDTLRVYDMGGRDPLFVAAEVRGPIDAAFLAGRFYFAGLEVPPSEAGEAVKGAHLALTSCDALGGAIQRLSVPIAPPELPFRLASRVIAERLVAVEVRLRGGGQGYRDGGGGEGAVVVRRDDEGILAVGASTLRLELAPAEGGVIVTFVRGRDESEHGAMGSFPRLRRVFGIERGLDEEEERFVASVCALTEVPPDAADADPSDAHLAVHLSLPTLPSAEALARWLKTLAQES